MKNAASLPDLSYWIAASSLPISLRKWEALLIKFGNFQTIFNASPLDWQQANLSEKDQYLLASVNWRSVDAALQWAENPNNHIVSKIDINYPALLKQISDPPLVLYVKGNLEILQQAQIAMVGSRKASLYGLRKADEFAANLAKIGYVITSGLALGIDSQAHKSALNAGGFSIGVAGTGLLHYYPRANKALVEAMVSEGKGTVISEFVLNAPPKKEHFPKRNRLIAGLSLGVLVVEAALQSGSLITARLAAEMGREVFAIPGNLDYAGSKGCHGLIKQGAALVENIEDILCELPKLTYNQRLNLKESRILEHNKQVDTLPEASKKLLLLINTNSASSLESLVARSGLTVGIVSSMLMEMELDGYLNAVPGGYILVK